MNKLKLYGKPDSPEIYPIRDFLKRSVVDFEWFDITHDDLGWGQGITSFNNPDKLPVIEFPDGKVIINPSLSQIACNLGWITQPKYTEYDLSIYGAGPAGLSAAVYAASEGLKTILIEREAIGGQAGTSSLIENYLGFPEGISGANLAERARQQALKFGVEILLLKEGIKGTFYNNRIHVDFASGEKLVAKTNICATGVEYARLNLPDENRFFHKGVYYGAGASEAFFCQDKDLYIIGGGNSAGQAATYFSGFAKRVFMVIRKGNLAETLSEYLIKRIASIKNIHVLYYSQVTALEGDDYLQRIKIVNSQNGTETWHDTSKLFICIGGKPNTEWAAETAICRDRNGYLYTGNDLINLDQYQGCWTLDRPPYHLETSVPGSFAAGDVRFNSVKRVASAVGEGAMAVTQVHQYLSKL
ncbi:pyridine nucleotide-disulfide oxidoreductase [Pedobacter sp. Leaf216]|uniref:NAD(P)/FAD-dependent oxidoreductase n=1 Tax=Pedobacter sp. Leaf216 TaxID=1735684 RepID=UPI0006F418ED|nr:FAD-dependent oxidoreductase [Pedobacter sp. Leaf216]KQM76331.1 pyridine nucleotide-disulfide oxidoreductase [Pedobacter sp. Leaf216]